VYGHPCAHTSHVSSAHAPPLHTAPAQHSLLLVQLVPGRPQHTGSCSTPPLPLFGKSHVSDTHAPPAWHVDRSDSVQYSPAGTPAPWYGRHTAPGVAHVCCFSLLHGAPSSAGGRNPHTPAMHGLLQQFRSCWQAPPSRMHRHRPRPSFAFFFGFLRSWQMRVQQSLSLSQTFAFRDPSPQGPSGSGRFRPRFPLPSFGFASAAGAAPATPPSMPPSAAAIP